VISNEVHKGSLAPLPLKRLHSAVKQATSLVCETFKYYCLLNFILQATPAGRAVDFTSANIHTNARSVSHLPTSTQAQKGFFLQQQQSRFVDAPIRRADCCQHEIGSNWIPSSLAFRKMWIKVLF
jgi:hypothetical protein